MGDGGYGVRARSVLTGFVVLGTTLALAASVGGASAQAATKAASTRSAASQPLNPKPNLHIMPTRQSSQAAKRASGAVMAAGINLSYWGGPVMQAGTQTIPIFWQPATLQDGTGSAPAAGYDSLIQQFFTDIGGHGYYNIMNQYYQVVAAQKQYIVNSSGFLQAVVDTSPYPASTGDCATNAIVNCITDTQLQTEIANVITAGSLPKDYSTAYFVFTDPMEASCASPSQCFNPENYNSFAYCAYHGEFLLGGQPVIYANMPYVDSEFISNILCGAGLSATGNQDFDDESSPLSHEFMEMVTDPNADASGWYDFTNNNGEIGDICVGDARPVTWGAHSYIIQTEYSNGDVACVPGGSNQITLTSTGGAPGSSTTVNGTGFTANHSVALSFSDASGTVTSLGSTTSNGSGAISQAVTIPGGASNGLGTLDATGASPGDGASAGFTVSGSGPTTFALTVSKSGNGSGGVTSSPAGIDCGATCQFSFNSGDSVTLTAAADVGSIFTGWSGSGCSGIGTCNVAMTQARSVTATFTLNTYALTVSKAGTGSGSVSSSPAGISCGATCQHSFNYNTSVTLTATADAGAAFAGWSGSGCSGTGTCSVSMTQARAVTATFTAVTFNLTVSEAGNGSGGVTSSPAGIDCGATCQFAFNVGDSVTLTAAADAGSTFTGWSGAGCAGTGTCDVSMTQAQAVTATFALNYRPDGLLNYKNSAYVGNGIYNTTGASQVRSVTINRGHTAVFHWRVQNDGLLSDQVLLSAAAGTTAFAVNFFSGTTNVTAAVVAGTYGRTLAPGTSFTLTLKIGVTNNAAIGAVRNELLTATSTNAPVSDAVLARVTAQ
jgi:Divergent InlB B-repeat domain